MAAYEVLLLNTAIPQIQAAQSGDTYVVPRDIAFSAALTLSAGTANGVPYLSSPGKVLTTGSALTFDGTNFALTGKFSVSQNSVGLAAEFTNADATNGYGVSIAAGGTSATRYALVVRNPASTQDYFKISTVTGEVGHSIFAPGAPGSSEIARFTTTGLGIGTSSPGFKLQVIGNSQISLSGAGTQQALQLNNNDTTAGTQAVKLAFSSTSVTKASINAAVYGNDYMTFNVGSDTERARISSDGTFRVKGAGSAGTTDAFQVAGTAPADAARIDSSGNLLVGTTSTSNGALINWYKASGTIETSSGGITTAQNHIVFANPNGNVGSIQVDGSATSYNTSSDYRLKNTIAPMTGALAKVALLKPCTYKWNVDGSDGEGFIAHELAEVCPSAVVGEKDAVDADGKPQYQGIDTSFLVATLTAAIQELKAEFDAYKATHP